VKLIIKNFRCIGPIPVSIDLDDIVVLVGPNNVGKSSVLKAYEVTMSEGSAAGQLTLDDFPSSKVDPNALPEIELHTIVFDNSPGDEWIAKTDGGEMLVRERWRWSAPGPPERRGFNVQLQRWAEDADKEKVPWGAAGVANSRRPQPHRVDAFASPDEQAGEIVTLLMTAIKNRVEGHRSDSKTNKESELVSHSFLQFAIPIYKGRTLMNLNPPTTQASQEVILEILKHKMDEGKTLITHYLRAFTIFIAITGALLKFAFDSNSTPHLRIALCWMGVFLSVFGLFVCYLGEKLRRTIRNDIARIHEILSVPLEPDSLTTVLLTTLASVFFVTLLLGGWIYFLLTPF